MSDERPNTDEGGDDAFRLSWPPSPKTQIILIALGFVLLNLLIIGAIVFIVAR